MSATKCEYCGERFKAQRRTARFCSAKCRNEAGRRRRAGTGPQAGQVIEQRAAAAADAPRATLVEAVEAELDTLGKARTMLGAQALEMAKLIANGGETGAAVAALSRELRAIMVLVSRGVEQGDEVDELKAKRDEKRQAAARTS